MIEDIERDLLMIDVAASEAEKRRKAEGHGEIDRIEFARVAFVAPAAVAVWFHWCEPFARFSVLGIVATLVGGYPIFKEPFENILERSHDHGTLDDDWAGEAIGDLLRYLPRTALVRRDGTIRELSVDALAIGDAVLVNPGATVAVDGEVVAGNGFVDEARITGESMPAEKVVGSLSGGCIVETLIA